MPLRKLIVLITAAAALACGSAAEEAVTSDGAGPDAVADATAAGASAAAPADSSAKPTSAGEQAPSKEFPPLDYLQQIPVAYTFAQQHPEVLERIPCYCPCELYGHGGLVDCYRSQHAAQCATCLEEALRARDAYAAADPADVAEVAAEVKRAYRMASVRSAGNDLPDARTPGGMAYLEACSDCHQPPHPAMYTPSEWRKPLARMEAYARQQGAEQDPQLWERAGDYVRAVSGRFDPDAGRDYRERLAEVVERLKADEGEAAHYPGPKDEILGPEWFERMVAAYRKARTLPVELLVGTATEDPTCVEVGHDTVLGCLNSNHAITSERTVSQIEALGG